MSTAIKIYIFIFILRNFAEAGPINEKYDIANSHVDQIRECTNPKNSEQLLVDPTLDLLRHKLTKFVKQNSHQKKRDVPASSAGKKKSHDTKNRGEVDSKPASVERWDDWTSWSSCSVSCGKGRHIRWRHCKQGCQGVETEMEQKLCQLPACPQKLFGLIKL